MKLVDRH